MTSCFSSGFNYIASYEQQAIGLNWDNIFESPIEGDQLNFAYSEIIQKRRPNFARTKNHRSVTLEANGLWPYPLSAHIHQRNQSSDVRHRLC